MNSEALFSRRDSSLLKAEVIGCSGEDYMVKSEAGSLVARRAAGCLLRPEIGDTVLTVSFGQGAYILSVLDRGGSDTEFLEIGGASLGGQEGRLTLKARDLEVELQDRAALSSAAIEAKTDSAKLYMRRICLFSRRAMLNSDRITLLGRLCHIFAGSLIQRLKQCRSIVEGLDFRKAGRSRLTVKEALFIKAKRSTIKAEDRMKVDGRKIDLG